MNPELQKYIQDALKSGARPEDISKALIEAGWDAGQVDAATRGSQHAPKQLRVAAAVIISLLGIGGVAGAIYFAVKAINKNGPPARQTPAVLVSPTPPTSAVSPESPKPFNPPQSLSFQVLYKEYEFLQSPQVIENRIVFIGKKNNVKYFIVDNEEFKLPDDTLKVGGLNYEEVVFIDQGVAYTVERPASDDLIARLHVFVNEKEVGDPLGHRGIKFFQNLGGKLLFVHEKSLNPFSTPSDNISFDYKIIGEYEHIGHVLILNGKIILTTLKGEVIIDGKALEDHLVVFGRILEIDDKLTFQEKNNKYIYFNGEKLGENYDSVSGLIEFNSLPAFIGKKGNKSFIQVGNSLYGNSKGYDFVGSLVEKRGHLYADAKQGVQYGLIIDGEFLDSVYSGRGLNVPHEVLDKSFNEFYKKLVSTNDEVFFSEVVPGILSISAKKSGQVVLYHGQKQFGPYETNMTILEALNWNGKLLYHIDRGPLDKGFVYIDNEKIYEFSLGYVSKVMIQDGKVVIYDYEKRQILREL